MRKDTELELLCLPSPAHPCEKMGGREVGPLAALVFIERVWERERERWGGGRERCLPTNVEEPNRCVKLIRDWLPLESIINRQVQITGNTGNVACWTIKLMTCDPPSGQHRMFEPLKTNSRLWFCSVSLQLHGIAYERIKCSIGQT